MESAELALLFLVFAYLIVISVHIFVKNLKLEEKVRFYYYGIAFFAITFLISRIFFLRNDIVFYQTGDIAQKQGPNYVIGSFFSTIATFGIMFVVEKYVYKKLRFVPSIVILICAVMILVLPKLNNINLVTVYSTISSIMAMLIPLLYIRVGLQVSGKPRVKSFILAVGIVVFFIGNVFNMGLLKDLYPIFIYISPITVLAGLIVFHYGLLIYRV